MINAVTIQGISAVNVELYHYQCYQDQPILIKLVVMNQTYSVTYAALCTLHLRVSDIFISHFDKSSTWDFYAQRITLIIKIGEVRNRTNSLQAHDS